MLRPVSLLPALVAVATLGATLFVAGRVRDGRRPPAGQGRRGAARGDHRRPHPLDPPPRRARSGSAATVTNNDTETWTAINLYAFVSDAPMTTAAELAEAADAAPNEDRRPPDPDPGTYDTVDELAPGETAQYSLRVPRSEIHVDQAGRLLVRRARPRRQRRRRATLRRRTGPHLPPAGPQRRRQRRHRAGHPGAPRRPPRPRRPDRRTSPAWTRTLSAGRPLRSLVDFGASAGSRPITWLVDPAVVDTVAPLVDGNPARSLEPTIDLEPTGRSGVRRRIPIPPPPTTRPTRARRRPGVGATPTRRTPRSRTRQPRPGRAWLDRLHAALEGNEILALPVRRRSTSPRRPRHDPQTSTRRPQALRRRAGAVGSSPTSPVRRLPRRLPRPRPAIELTEPTPRCSSPTGMFRGDAAAVAQSTGRTRGRDLGLGRRQGGPGPDDPLDRRRRAAADRQ